MTEPIQSPSPNASYYNPAEQVCSLDGPSMEGPAPALPPPAPPPTTGGTRELVDGRTPDTADFVAQSNQDEVCGGAIQKAAIDCTLAAGAVAGAAALAYGTAGTAAMLGSALGVAASLARCHDAVNAAVEQCGGGS